MFHFFQNKGFYPHLCNQNIPSYLSVIQFILTGPKVVVVVVEEVEQVETTTNNTTNSIGTTTPRGKDMEITRGAALTLSTTTSTPVARGAMQNTNSLLKPPTRRIGPPKRTLNPLVSVEEDCFCR